MSATAFLELLGLKAGASVALMGAGGKHTLMARLKQELTAAGISVLLTSSTNLHRPTGKGESPLLLVSQHPNWSAELTERLRQWQAVYLLEQDLGLVRPGGLPALRKRTSCSCGRGPAHSSVLSKVF